MNRKLRDNFILIVFGSVVILVTFGTGLRMYGNWYERWGAQVAYGDCNVAVVPVVGEIVSAGNPDASTSPTTLGDEAVAQIESAENDDSIKAVLVTIDSGGGSPVASEMVMNALKRLTKPSVAVIGESGDSGAYLIATGANRIIASRFSDVGSIGITESYLNVSEQDAQNGVVYEQLSSGPYKDMLSPDKPLTAAERDLVERDLQAYSQWFIQLVSQNRKLPVAAVQKLADGSTLPGELALKAGLIDELGDQQTAEEWLKGQIGQEAILCEY